MGDRVYVTLRVLKNHADTTRQILLAAANGELEDDSPDKTGIHHSFGFSGINYGDLDGLDKLIANGIAYNSCWERGYDFGPGTQYCRFTEQGECITEDLYADDTDPPITELLSRIDEPEVLRSYILQHHKDHTLPSWDHQEDYGNLYRALQLIT